MAQSRLFRNLVFGAFSLLAETRGSLAWTFGWFLRIAIAANAAFYYAIFLLLANLLARWSAK